MNDEDFKSNEELNNEIIKDEELKSEYLKSNEELIISEEIKNEEPLPIFLDYCKWIRDNIQEYKLSYVKNFLSRYDNYFDVDQSKMIEHCYRACKNSFKIRYAYEETADFVRMLVYLLSSSDKEFDVESDVEMDLIHSIGTESFIYNYFMKAKTGIIDQKGHYYLFDKVALTWLGSNVLFFYILTSVVYVVEKSLTDKNYKFIGILNWQEAIANYVLAEFIRKSI